MSSQSTQEGDPLCAPQRHGALRLLRLRALRGAQRRQAGLRIHLAAGGVQLPEAARTRRFAASISAAWELVANGLWS